MIVPLIFAAILVSIVVRLIVAPFRYRHWRRRELLGYGDPHYNPYLYGCRRRHRLVGGLLPILALVALDRIFFGRRF
jgi:hypothetical protein